jgi:RND family efflux transporter MFP subunit
MKLSLKWVAATAIGIVLLGGGVYRALASRETANQALQSQQALQKAQATVMLSDTDVSKVQLLPLVQTLPVSGPIKAVNSAFVKARVSGELQDLAVREGDSVKAGQFIARVDVTEYQARLRQAQLQADAAKAQVDIAKRALDNNKALVDQGFISKTALDSSLSTLAANVATFQAAQAGADVARKAVDDAVLQAPIGGQIAQRLAQPGERVAVDAKVVEIVDLSRLELEASLSAADSLRVKIGQVATLLVEGSVAPVSSKVVRINPSATAASRAVLVYLSLDSGSNLRQGLFARGTLATGSSQTLAVPLDCVRSDKPKPYLQIMRGGVVVHQTIETGVQGTALGQDMIEVRGVAAETEILRGNVGGLREGTLLARSAGKT